MENKYEIMNNIIIKAADQITANTEKITCIFIPF